MPEDTFEDKNSSPVDPSHQLPPPDSKRKRNPLVRVAVWIVILLLFALLFWVVIRHKEVASTAPRGRQALAGGTVTLTMATAKKGNIGVYLQAIGTVTPIHTDTITSQASGLISEVDYREGQMVRQGEKLVQIDPRPYSAQVLAAQGALERDTNLLAQAQMDLERYQAAWAKNAIARQTLEDQEKLVEQYKGTVKADQGTLQLDQVDLSYCNITAPISGQAGLRLVDPGNVVTSNSTTPLVVITQMQPMTVVFTIPEDNVEEVAGEVRHGQTLEVDAFDRTQQKQLATGKLLSLDNQIDPTTGTLKLRAVFPNRDNALYPNLFVNARLLVKMLNGVTLIPSSAIQYNGEQAFVYLIQNNTAHIQNVKPGVADSGMTQVTGVNPGDAVATSSFEKLQNNAKVVVAKTAPASSSSTESNAP